MAHRRPGQQQQKKVEWDFFTFPVYWAITIGMLIGFFLTLFLGYYAFTVALFGVSFGFFHMVTQQFKKRTVDRRLQREEDEERNRRAFAARQTAALEGEQASAAAQRRRRRRR